MDLLRKKGKEKKGIDLTQVICRLTFLIFFILGKNMPLKSCVLLRY